MKPCCRILVGYKSRSLFGFSPPKLNDSIIENSSKSRFKSAIGGRFGSSNSQIVGYICVTDQNRRSFSDSGSNWGQSRVFRRKCLGITGNKFSSSSRRRRILVVSNVASDFRNHSTSVDKNVNEKSFESIYIQGGLNVKPLVIERIETKEEESSWVDEVNDPHVNIDSSKGLNETKVEREVSESEKDAWKLLLDSVVTYCGNPVGTVAANDPVDKQPLNYDQVFIRDFVPSALAFLLNGEPEIVKNFLLHTLQLQVCWLFSLSSSAFLLFIFFVCVKRCLCLIIC